MESPSRTRRPLRTAARELVHDIAMQIAAADPQFLGRDDVTAEFLDQGKGRSSATRALAEGKPEKIVDKIVEGRMTKFYEEVCLLEQPFIKENTLTIDPAACQTRSPARREHRRRRASSASRSARPPPRRTRAAE